MNSPYSLPHRQQGAVLIVALIMLLLLTIIGLSSMRGTSLQENMAGNMRDINLALQAAEAALRQGEGKAAKDFSPNAPLHTQQTGTYDDFPGTAEEPTYTITLLEKFSTSTAMPPEFDSALVVVESDGYGLNTNSDDTPSSHSELRSTFLFQF
ncbi:pilus assembly protein PilX [Pseudomonas sp. LPH1]|nr:PilX N-terminal domain-containing pilus assembly protein [Pseudomonas sp. LPH1]AQZ34850.1 pilus assembly protein PilX [Pseudomonas sp. LPH1]